MKKALIALGALAVFSCQEAPKKDYVTLSGTITNQNSDSLFIRSRSYSKTIQVKTDGTFSDTLKVEDGFFSLYDGAESKTVYLKNGYDLNITLNTEEFDETITYTGEGAENNNFLAEEDLKKEVLLDQDFSELDKTGLTSKFDEIESEMTTFYSSKKAVDTLVSNTSARNLTRFLGSYENYYANTLEIKEALTGKPSPLFVDYANADGSKTSLESLKGKYVYIDVWATWCAPCKAEIPALKELEKTYADKNIEFVSVSVDDDRTHGGSWDKAKEDWLAMVEDKELKGIQVMAPKGWKSQFVQDYLIKGIPRFILIDPQGLIVDPSAPRPSSDKIKEVFNALTI